MRIDKLNSRDKDTLTVIRILLSSHPSITQIKSESSGENKFNFSSFKPEDVRNFGIEE